MNSAVPRQCQETFDNPVSGGVECREGLGSNPDEVFRSALPNLQFLEQHQQVIVGALDKGYDSPRQSVFIGPYYMNRGDISGQWKIEVDDAAFRLKAIAAAHGFLFDLERIALDRGGERATPDEVADVVTAMNGLAQMTLERSTKAQGNTIGRLIGRALRLAA